jgi:hypothetical protein
MSEREEDILSVVASTWSEGANAEKTDGCEIVDEMEDMEGDWEVIDEVGDSDGPPQDDPSFISCFIEAYQVCDMYFVILYPDDAWISFRVFLCWIV